jgi:hypothetical protein
VAVLRFTTISEYETREGRPDEEYRSVVIALP